MTRYRRLAAVLATAVIAVASAPGGALASPVRLPASCAASDFFTELSTCFGLTSKEASALVNVTYRYQNTLHNLIAHQKNADEATREQVGVALRTIPSIVRLGLRPECVQTLLKEMAKSDRRKVSSIIEEMQSAAYKAGTGIIEPGSQFAIGNGRWKLQRNGDPGNTVTIDPGDADADNSYIGTDGALYISQVKHQVSTYKTVKGSQKENLRQWEAGKTGSTGGLKRGGVVLEFAETTAWTQALYAGTEVKLRPALNDLIMQKDAPISEWIRSGVQVRIGNVWFKTPDLIRLRASVQASYKALVPKGTMSKDEFYNAIDGDFKKAAKVGIQVPGEAPATKAQKKKAAKAEEKIAENLGCKGQPAVGMARGSAPVLAAVPMAAAACPAGKQQSSGLAQALQNPGGIDFTSLGLRYMSDDPGSGGVQYAFSGRPASPGITQNTDTGVDAVTNSTADLRTWLVLSPQTFWVNLNPSQPDKIVDAKLGRTNAGKALLEADLRLKQTSAKLLNPKTSLGARYWKALGNGTCYSDRLWIVPGEVQVREDGSSLYVLRADLSVKTQTMNIDNVGSKSCHPDPDTAARMEKLERTAVLPKIIKAVNTEAGYAPLRRAFLARVVAQWIRDRHAAGHRTSFDDLLGSGDLGPATLTDGWRPRQVFDTYVHSVKDGAFTYKKTVRIGNRIYKQSETVGGVDFSRLNPSRIGAAQMNQQHPHLAQTVRNAASRPANDSDGTIWLGATAPTPDPGPWANATGTIGDFVTSRTGILVLVVVALGVLTFGIRGGRRKRPAA